jgi:heme-degrading monooxygenase HmoA
METLMIARTWRGATTVEAADAYVEYLRRTGLADFRKTPGNRGALGLRRILNGRAEFMVVSLWESEEAVRRFAGDRLDRAVFYPQDEQFLIERDEQVAHYEVIHWNQE